MINKSELSKQYHKHEYIDSLLRSTKERVLINEV